MLGRYYIGGYILIDRCSEMTLQLFVQAIHGGNGLGRRIFEKSGICLCYLKVVMEGENHYDSLKNIAFAVDPSTRNVRQHHRYV